MEDKEFKKANVEYEKFLLDFKDLLNKYKCQYTEHDQYNGEERYIGHELYLVINGTNLYRDTVEEMIKKLIKEGR